MEEGLDPMSVGMSWSDGSERNLQSQILCNYISRRSTDRGEVTPYQSAIPQRVTSKLKGARNEHETIPQNVFIGLAKLFA